MADKDGVEVCWLYEDDWQEWVDSGTAVYYFDPKLANKAINFFPLYLRHMKGYLRLKAVALEQWQKEFIGRFFGWLCIDPHEMTGRIVRRYLKLFLFIPRKNGKSLIVAGLGLYLLLCDGEGSPEVYVGAGSEEQARNLFNVAKFMVKNDEDLRSMAEPLRDAIFVETSDGAMKVIAAVGDMQEGTNPSAFICDELHVQDDTNLIDSVENGMGSRDQAASIYLTTAGRKKKDTPCGNEYDYACKVRDGIIRDARYLAVIYEAPKETQLDDPNIYEILEACNPNWNVSVSKSYFEPRLNAARHIPSKINDFKRKHLNIWVEGEDLWIDYARWLMCKQKIDTKRLLKRSCWAGLDLGVFDDLSALVLVFPPEKHGEKWIALPFFWCPEVGIEKRAELAKVNYGDWVENGFITATRGETTDFNYIYDRVVDLSKLFDLQELSFDPCRADMLCKQLEEYGIEVNSFRQGPPSMHQPIEHLIASVLNGHLIHDDPVLDWMASNACLEFDRKENMCFSKGKSTDKIDGMVALAMAMGRAVLNYDFDGDPFEYGLRAA